MEDTLPTGRGFVSVISAHPGVGWKFHVSHTMVTPTGIHPQLQREASARGFCAEKMTRTSFTQCQCHTHQKKTKTPKKQFGGPPKCRVKSIREYPTSPNLPSHHCISHCHRVKSDYLEIKGEYLHLSIQVDEHVMHLKQLPVVCRAS